jgi:glutathione S-transferase
MLSLTGRDYEWIETDVLAQETRSAEFLKMNPVGKVPVMMAPDGRCLSESNAMLLHLAEGTAWLPADAWTRALVYQWLFFEQYSHEPTIAVARFIVHLAGREQEDRERLVQLHARGREALSVMDRALGDQKYFAGRDFTIADIALYAYTHVADEGNFQLEDFPSVCRWLGDVAARPGHLSMAQACR